MQITTFWRVTRRALQDWWDDNCLCLAASLAFYTALSLAPLVLLIVGVAGVGGPRRHAGHRRRPRHPAHQRHGDLWRAPGDAEPRLGGPAGLDRRGLGRDLGPTQG